MARFGRLELRPFWDDDGGRQRDGRAVGARARALAEAMAAERLRIVASLIRTTRDWDLAEDAVADAAERALATVADDGIPQQPGGVVDDDGSPPRHRRAAPPRQRTHEARGGRLGRRSTISRLESRSATIASGSIFTCCHPALSMEARVALTLKVVSDLSTASIGRLFLTSENTMGQRLLRAKQKIANGGIPYRVPRGRRAARTARRRARRDLPRLHRWLRDGHRRRRRRKRRSASAGCSSS